MKKISPVLYNFFYLGIYQGLNFLFPLLITPIILDVIGIVNFGITSAAQALMNIFIVIVDYGFNMSGTKEISSNHENENIVNGIINSILTIKIFIVIIAFLFLLLLVYFVPSYKKENLLYILSFALPLGRAFFPVWYFQGMQKMQFLIFFSLISKGLAALFIILFITKPENYILINLIIGSTDFIGSLIMLFIVFYLFKYKFSIPTKNEIVFQVKNGFYLFLASFFAMVISNSYLIILGFFGTGKQVGIYSVSDKIVFFIKQLPSIAFQAIYPHACRVWENSKKLFFSLLNKLYLSYFVILLIINLVVCVFSFPISHFFTKSETSSVSALLSIMCFLTIISGLNLPSMIGMLVTNENKYIGLINSVAAVISLLFGFVFIYYLNYWGALITMFIVELFITLSQFIIIHKKYLKLKPILDL